MHAFDNSVIDRLNYLAITLEQLIENHPAFHVLAEVSAAFERNDIIDDNGHINREQCNLLIARLEANIHHLEEITVDNLLSEDIAMFEISRPNNGIHIYETIERAEIALLKSDVLLKTKTDRMLYRNG